MRPIEEIRARLRQSTFRSRFRLGATERAYVDEKGRALVMRHAADFIAKRLAPAFPANDGRQTPMRGHPVFLAQHATATCCRGCLAKWHAIPMGTALADSEQAYVLQVIGHWIDEQMAASVKLRSAAPSDLAVLRRWAVQPHVIAATVNSDTIDWEDELRRDRCWRELLIAERDGRPIGMLEIIDCAREETGYWGDVRGELRAIDIWIGEASDLGRGYGTAMMRLALTRCFAAREAEAILVDPLVTNTRAHRFFERLGFSRAERRMFESDDCYVYRLDRVVWTQNRTAS